MKNFLVNKKFVEIADKDAAEGKKFGYEIEVELDSEIDHEVYAGVTLNCEITQERWRKLHSIVGWTASKLWEKASQQ